MIFTSFMKLKAFQASQIWHVLRTMSWYDTCKIFRKNSNHNRNGSGFCEAPLKCNFTTAMVRISIQRDKQDNLCKFSITFHVAKDSKNFKKMS